MAFIVAIDGPAGTGKGTITKLVAKDFGLINIDTGATYRCVTLEMLNQNISIHETEKIIKISENINMKIENNNGFQTIFLNEEDVTEKIRSKEVTELVSQVSSIVEVRLNMVKLQRKLAEGKDVIMEGRDITTYVFPNANVKIYLDADVEERAKRRYKENLEKVVELDKIINKYLEDYHFRGELQKSLTEIKVTSKVKDIVDFIVTSIIGIFNNYKEGYTRKIYIPRWI